MNTHLYSLTREVNETEIEEAVYGIGADVHLEKTVLTARFIIFVGILLEKM
ncbi:hypothetical protein YC2023_075379 [Brassica napus]